MTRTKKPWVILHLARPQLGCDLVIARHETEAEAEAGLARILADSYGLPKGNPDEWEIRYERNVRRPQTRVVRRVRKTATV